MLRLLSSASRIAILILLPGMAGPALAASFTVSSGSTQTAGQTLSDIQTGTVETGGTLAPTSGVAVTFGMTTGTGTVLTNNGAITASARALDSTAAGTFTITNAGTISSTGSDAFRISNAFIDGRLLLTNSGTISASGRAIQLNAANSASANITINNSGTLSSSADDAVRLGSGTITLTNSGTIQSTAASKRAIKFDTATNIETLRSFTLTNLTGGLITALDDAIKIAGGPSSTSSAVISIDNSGTISSTAGGQAIDLGDLVSTNLAITITNRAGGTITASDNDAIMAGMNTTVYNYGQIIANYTTASPDTQNFDGVKFEGGSGSVFNYAGATISGSYHGVKASGTSDNIAVSNWGTIQGRNGSGVNSNGTGSVLNYGTISGTFDPAASFGDGDGVDFDGIGTITNYGSILGLGSNGIKPGETTPSTSEAIAIGGGTITNGSASVRSALISGANNGILADDSNRGSIFGALTVTNYGTIRGLDGYGIQIINDSGFSNTIVNYGTISGTTFAVAMGNGDDMFVYQAGSSVVGAVKGEGGTDTLRLGDVSGSFNLALLGDAATYQGFELLDLAVGSAWTVSGTSTFSGATQVAGASLTLDNASLAASTVTVSGTGAVLAGSGTLGALLAGSGATISPGLAGAVGTLAVNGAVQFNTGSLYAVTVASGATDRITAGGAATLSSGAGVSVLAGGGTFNFSQTYTILSATGGVSGTFGTVTSDFAFLTAALSYDASNVYLTFSRNGTSFASIATTGNTRQAAAAIEAGGTNTALYNAVATGTVASAQSAFQLLSGEAQASYGSTTVSQTQMIGDVIDGRLRQASYAGATGALAGLGSGGPAAYAATPVVKAGPFTAPAAAPPAQPWTGWFQGYGQWNHFDGNSNTSAMNSTLGGVMAGLDTTVGNWTLGFAAGYGWSESSVANLGSSLETSSAQFALYGGTSFGALKLRAGANLAYSDVDSTRTVVVGSVSETPTASYDGWSGGVFGEAAYALPAGGLAFEPYAQLAWSGVELGGFNEGNAPITGLSSSGLSFSTWYTTVGLRAAAALGFAGLNAVPHLSLGWRHAYGDLAPSVAVTYLNTGTGFTVQGVLIAEDSVVVGAGLEVPLGKGLSVGVSYDGAFASSSQSNAVRGTLGIAF